MMRTATFAILGAALMAMTVTEAASAAERQHVRKVERAPAALSQSVRNSNAYYWPSQQSVPLWERYAEGGAISAPAGH